MTDSTALLSQLPHVEGEYRPDYALEKVTWFRVGGPADILYKPEDLDDLITFLKNKPADIPVMIMGVGSNLLVRDGGIEGVVIRLGKAFATLELEDTYIHAGAGCLDINTALFAQENSIGGLEFLSGIPGTIGGALAMNAGAYGVEMADRLLYAEALDPEGTLHRLEPEAMGFSYRHTGIPKDWIFTKAVLKGYKETPSTIAEKMQQIQEERELSQPTRARTGGSTFVNPPDNKAWELIDAAGCRGLNYGGAMVSEKHCNFLINNGDASAADLEELGEMVRQRVEEHSGVQLQWEIKRVGR